MFRQLRHRLEQDMLTLPLGQATETADHDIAGAAPDLRTQAAARVSFVDYIKSRGIEAIVDDAHLVAAAARSAERFGGRLRIRDNP